MIVLEALDTEPAQHVPISSIVRDRGERGRDRGGADAVVDAVQSLPIFAGVSFAVRLEIVKEFVTVSARLRLVVAFVGVSVRISVPSLKDFRTYLHRIHLHRRSGRFPYCCSFYIASSSRLYEVSSGVCLPAYGRVSRTRNVVEAVWWVDVGSEDRLTFALHLLDLSIRCDS